MTACIRRATTVALALGCLSALEQEQMTAFQTAYAAAANPVDKSKPSTPVHKLGAVTITSQPPGAKIRAGEKWIGTTPWSGELAPGAINIELRLSGCSTTTVTIHPNPGKKTVVNPVLDCDFLVE